MEMTYGGALVMPSSYAMMDEEEMMYLDGGALSFYVNADACATLTTYINFVTGVSTVALGAVALEKTLKKTAGKIAGMIKMLFKTLGVIGFIAAVIGTAVLCANAVSFCVGTVTADRKNTGVTMNWYGAYFGGFKYA